MERKTASKETIASLIQNSGKAIEELGFYDPHSKEEKISVERADYWLGVGAAISETAKAVYDRAKAGTSLKDKVRVQKPSKKAQAKAAAEAEAKAKAEAEAAAAAEASAEAPAEA